MRLQHAALPPRVGRDLIIRYGQQERLGRGIVGRSPLSHGLRDPGTEFVINAAEQRAVPWGLRKADNIRDVPHDPAGEEGAIRLAGAVGNTVSLQKIDERQGGIMVAIKHSRVFRQIARDLKQVGVLPLAAVQRDLGGWLRRRYGWAACACRGGRHSGG